MPGGLGARAHRLSNAPAFRTVLGADMGDSAGMRREDAELVAHIRHGDAVAADELVRRHFRAAYAVALALLGNAMDAEDVCQDAFVRALERIEKCRKPDRFVY